MNTIRTTGRHSEIPVFSGELFAWTPTSGVTEASTLGMKPGARMFPAIIHVQSHRTGVVRKFVWVNYGASDSALYSEYMGEQDLRLEILNH